MRLLLTSEGFPNQTIRDGLAELLGQPYSESSIVCVTTSANAVAGDKRWMLSILDQIREMGFREIDLLDIAGLPQDIYLSRLETAHVIYVFGGHSQYLMDELERAELAPILADLLQTRVYAGNSAGSIVAAPSLAMANPAAATYSEERPGRTSTNSLGFSPVHIRPHLNRAGHPSTPADVENMIANHNVTEPVYLIDDESAVLVHDDAVRVLSEGQWQRFN